MPQPHDDATKCTPQAIKHLQKIIGTFLFYSRAVEPTMLTALSIITTELTQGTDTTKQKAEHFLAYAIAHPNDTIKFYKSDMILKIHSGASYLSEQQGRSCTRGATFTWVIGLTQPTHPIAQFSIQLAFQPMSCQLPLKLRHPPYLQI